MIREKHPSYVAGDVLIHIMLALLALSCLLPFVYVIARSVSSAAAVERNQVTLWPIGFNVDNYRYLITRDDWFLGSFLISVARVFTGVAVNLLIVALTAYPLSQDRLYIPGRTVFKAFMLFGMLFSGGLIPTYLAYKSLGLLNKFAVLIIPGAFNIFYTIVLVNFFRGLPPELYDSAMIDGASHLDVLLRIFLPLSLPSLATISLFSAVSHWNAWFDGIVFLKLREQWPLQSYLYVRVTAGSLMSQLSGREMYKLLEEYKNATPEALAAAMIVLASIPIMLAYPFVQRYFITGLTLGAVKG